MKNICLLSSPLTRVDDLLKSAPWDKSIFFDEIKVKSTTLVEQADSIIDAQKGIIIFDSCIKCLWLGVKI